LPLLEFDGWIKLEGGNKWNVNVATENKI
jgi:hypothetical protein